MKKSAEIIGLSVISIMEGRELGTVKELLINPAEGRVGALVIADEKWYRGAKFLPFYAITGLGEYAVTVESSNDLFVLSAVPEFEELLEANIKVIGTKVLTRTTGQIQGKVTEFSVDDAGKMMICEVEETSGELTQLSTDRVITFGKDVLIIAGPEEVLEAVPDTAVQQATPLPMPKAERTAAPLVAPSQPATGARTVSPEVKPAKADNPAAEEAANNKNFDDKHRKYLLGKKASHRIETDNGVLIVDGGGDITEEVLQKAKLAGKFVELSMNIH